MTTPALWISAKLSSSTRVLQKHARWVLLSLLLISSLALIYGVRNIGINTSTSDMFSADLAWRVDFIQFKKFFPQLVENILVVIDSATPEDADRIQRNLARHFSQQTQLFNLVLAPESSDFFARNGLLYLSTEELQTLSDGLARSQPLLARLARTPNISGLASLLEESLNSTVAPQQELKVILESLGNAFAANDRGESRAISWRSILLPEAADKQSSLRRIILLAPKLDFSIAQPRKAAFQAIADQISKLELPPHSRIRLTGSLAMQYQEQQTVAQGMATGAAVTFALVIGVLFLALRSWRLVSASLLTLMCGLALTVAFAAATVGQLNLISIAFAVLYIGLGIDFAIHYCLHYREKLDQGESRDEAVSSTAGEIGSSLVLCAVTTAVGFYSFSGTDFIGMAELGVISGTGMFFSLSVTLLLLPVLLHLMGPQRKNKQKLLRNPILTHVGRLAAQNRNTVRLIALLLAISAVWMARDTTFDSNPLNLRDSKSESVATYLDLLQDGDTTPLTLSAIVPEPGVAPLEDRLDALSTVAGTRSIRNLVPLDQPSKLDIIADLQLLLGDVGPITPTTSNRERDLGALTALAESLERSTDNPLQPQFHRFNGILKQWISNYTALSAAQQQQRLEQLSHSLFQNLSSEWQRMLTGFQASPISRADLPPGLRSLWTSASGQDRVEIQPQENLASNRAIRHFVESVATVAPHSTGLPAVQIYGGRTVVLALLQAFATAFGALILLLLVLTRSVRSTLIVIAPLLLAALMTCAATVLLEVPFNFANVITLPLLLGVGVDNGIHLVHRHQIALPTDGNLLATATARAIFYSSITTVCSFGTLAFSNHPGTASMGLLLTIGMALSLLSALFLAPALLSSGRAKGGERP